MPTKLRKKQIEELRQELETRRDKITQHLANGDDERQELQEYYEQNDVKSKNDESADEITDFFTDFAVTESLEKTLKDINQALDLMEKGDYGACKYCGAEIPIERMRIRPVSTSCVKCKSQFTN